MESSREDNSNTNLQSPNNIILLYPYVTHSVYGRLNHFKQTVGCGINITERNRRNSTPAAASQTL